MIVVCASSSGVMPFYCRISLIAERGYSWGGVGIISLFDGSVYRSSSERSTYMLSDIVCELSRSVG